MRSQSGKQRLPLPEDGGSEIKHDGGSLKDATTQARTEDTVLVVSEQEPKSLEDSIHRETILFRELDRDRSVDRSTASLPQTWRLHIVASPWCTLPKQTCPLISSHCMTNPQQPHCPRLFASCHTLHLHHTLQLHLHRPKHPHQAIIHDQDPHKPRANIPTMSQRNYLLLQSPKSLNPDKPNTTTTLRTYQLHHTLTPTPP